MNNQGTAGAPSTHTEPAPAFSGSRFLLASCAAAATASYLGAWWLKVPVMGLPTGVWLIAIAQGGALAWHQRGQRLARDSAAATGNRRTGVSSFDLGNFVGRSAAAAVDALRCVAHSLEAPAERTGELEDRIARRLDWINRSAGPLRIGVDAPPDVLGALVAQSASTEEQWVAVTPATDDAATMRQHALDAMIRFRSDSGLQILTPEHPGKDAAWFDWALDRPLTYASLFPTRLDTAQVTIEEFDPSDSADGALVALLARVAAALSRTPARLNLSDRFRGRMPESATGPQPAGTSHVHLRALAGVLANSASVRPTPARRAAARLMSAWLSGADLDMNLRRSAAEAALAVLGEAPEILLRTAAVRFAAGDDRAALSALVRAERLIREQHSEAAIDHLPFLQSEVELGLPGPMTLGRVAAGICLVCATSPPSRVPYIRGDVMDDARYSSWLVGRDQERLALEDVFRVLEEATRAGKPEERRRAA